jgi:hypothetical protein
MATLTDQNDSHNPTLSAWRHLKKINKMAANTNKIITGGDWRDKATEAAKLEFVLHVHDANAHMKILNKALCYFI